MTKTFKTKLTKLTLTVLAAAASLAAQQTPVGESDSQGKMVATPAFYGNPLGAGPQAVGYPPNGVLNMIALGADPTGVKDSAPAIRSVVASVGTAPATLYFPKGTYRFASQGPNGREQCVRITGSISLLGDGPGLTVFTDDPVPACVAQIGYFYTNSQSVPNNDYSFERDPGFAASASSAPMGSSSLTLTNHSNASAFSAGQYVYVRGTALPQNGEYHGELNRVASSGNGSTGVVSLLWPLSSDFTHDSNLQLNLVASTEVVTNIQISGITFNCHDEALMGAQLLGVEIFDNTFNYIGSLVGNEVNQLNQTRNVEFHHNTVNNPQGPAIDPERNSNTWNIHDNTIFGYFDAGEGGANFNFHDNTITCVNSPSWVCVRFGGTTGNTADHNQINASCPSDACHAITDVSGPFTSPATIISNNTIVAKGVRAISVQTPGTVISGNTIFTDSTGIDMSAGGISAFNNTVTMTASGVYGCILVEGDSHNDLIEGLNCTGYTPSLDTGIWIANNGPQSVTPLIIDGMNGRNLRTGIYITNGLYDIPIMGGAWFTNTVTSVVNNILPQ